MLVDIVERLSNWKHASFRRDGSTLETMMEAANEITSLREQLEIAKKDGWISVDTALPDDEITFLSFSPVYGFQVNMFNIHGNGGLPKLAQLKITHWQPLPEPPKE